MPQSALRSQASQARRFFHAGDECWHVNITQGETYVTADAAEVLGTVLGSCIAACIRDPAAGVGGMNHFLLPGSRGGSSDAPRYGVNAMELLINQLLQLGAVRHRLEAKLFGGASVVAGLSDVGASNIAFAQKFLTDEGIVMVGGDVGGAHPRRIQYWPVSGRARQRSMPVDQTLVAQELQAAVAPRKEEGNDVELF